MNLKVSLEHSQRVKLQIKGETPLLGWLSQFNNVLKVSALPKKLAKVVSSLSHVISPTAF